MKTPLKTLDETIKGLEYCLNPADELGNCNGDCPYCPSCDPEGTTVKLDALYYLKEYQTLQYSYIKAMADIEDNPPLSWDELKQMEGRPVWIEAESLSVGVSPYWKNWHIIKSFSNDEFMYCNDGFEWAKEMQGRLWQAYRKERE